MDSTTAATPRPDPFEGRPGAPRSRRIAAIAIDTFVVFGSPWVLLLPCLGILVVSAFWGIPLWAISCIAAAMLHAARRQPNGDRVSAGQLVTGLTVVRSTDAQRVVRVADGDDALRPKRWRIVTAWVAVALAALAAVGILGTAVLIYYEVNTRESRAAEQETEWATHEPDARLLVDTFITDLLSSNRQGGAGYVTGAAGERLPAYRARVRREGVNAFELEGSGQGSGTWEYMFREVNPVQSRSPIQRTVSIMVEELDGRLVITQIAPSESYEAPQETP